MIGKTISHYKILDKLGEGGMGVVYKAHDTKLDRTVALKFLPRAATTTEEDKQRFIREAKTAASLSHANICTVYEVDEIADKLFLALEYIEGITLKQWIQTHSKTEPHLKQRTIKEAVEFALQMAEGIARAHERGIIHRDVKPDNVMITHDDNRIKIMDFGLAKIRNMESFTKTGTTVGTLFYMSPEQVEGLETDHRSDIYSFGVVLYEMLSGNLPYSAAHEAALVYEIINVSPLIIGDVDNDLNRIIQKCLEKDRNGRYQSMQDIIVDLKRYLRNTENRSSPSNPVSDSKLGSRKVNPRYIIAVVTVGVIFVAMLLYYIASQTESVSEVPTLSKVTFISALQDEPTWSPDGRFIAYTTNEKGKLDIVVKPLDGGEPIWIVESPADDAQPAWSPDGSTLAFVSARDHGGQLSTSLWMGAIQGFVYTRNGDIFLISAFGGTPSKLIENAYYPSWSPDGKEIVFVSNRGGKWDLWIIGADGSGLRQLTTEPGFKYHPSWSPDGEWIVYGGGSAPDFSLRIIPATGGEPFIGYSFAAIRPTWSNDGRHILFSLPQSGGINIWKLPFRGRSTSRTPNPIRVTLGEGADVNVSAHQIQNKIAFTTVKNVRDIWEFDIQSNKISQVTSTTTPDDLPHLSSDGVSLLITTERGARDELWVYNLEKQTFSKLSVDHGSNGVWSPDGKRIAYLRGTPDAPLSTIVIQAVGDIRVEEIYSHDEGIPYLSWSPDGRRIAFSKWKSGKSDVWVYSFESDEVKQVTSHETGNSFPTWSPDGKYITYSAEVTGTRTIWMIPSEGGTPVQLTFGEVEHSHPQWSPVDPDIILFLTEHKNICLLQVSTGEIKQLTNIRDAGVTIDYPTWSSDGKKVYFSLDRKVGDIFVMENY
jgi:eukaryotic-like serine/threonine-protein kinase